MILIGPVLSCFIQGCLRFWSFLPLGLPTAFVLRHICLFKNLKELFCLLFCPREPLFIPFLFFVFVPSGTVKVGLLYRRFFFAFPSHSRRSQPSGFGVTPLSGNILGGDHIHFFEAPLSSLTSWMTTTPIAASYEIKNMPVHP